MIHKSMLIRVAAGLWISDVVGTDFIWRGAPFDSALRLSFWHFEATRLCYWAVCVSLAGTIWVLFLRSVRTFMGRSTSRTVSTVQKMALGLLAAVLVLAVEIVTSLWYWRESPWGKIGISNVPYCPYDLIAADYLWGHLTGWTCAAAVSAAAWIAWIRTKRRGQVAQSFNQQ